MNRARLALPSWMRSLSDLYDFRTTTGFSHIAPPIMTDSTV